MSVGTDNASVRTGGCRPVTDNVDEPTTSRTAGRAARRPAKSGGVIAAVREAAIILVTALVLSLLIKTFLAQAFYIPSASMEDTLDVGDRVMVSLLTPGPFELDRGDVVVFKDPGDWLTGVGQPDRGPVSDAMVQALTFVGVLPQDAGQHLIKRAIGLPGDQVACCDAAGRLTVNGKPVQEETYLKPGAEPSADTFDVTVPPGRLWVMGDNRGNSEDSRAHYIQADYDVRAATVPISNVVGKAAFVFYPWSNRQVIDDHDEVFAAVPP